MKGKSTVALLVCVVTLAAAINLVYASATLWVTDTDGNAQTMFHYTDTIRINWQSTQRVDITVTYYESEYNYENDIDGEFRFELTDQNPVGTYDFVPNEIGFFLVECTNAGKVKVIASGTILTIPESVLGTLMATVAGFAAIGVFRYNCSRKIRTYN